MKETAMQSRRDVLTAIGLGAGAVALHGVTSGLLASGAQAAAPSLVAPGLKAPKRFVFVMKSNGLRPHSLTPMGNEPIQDRGRSEYMEKPLAKETLGTSMKALEPLKDYTNILLGLSCHHVSHSHGFGYGALAAAPTATRPLSATIDCALGALYETPFPIIGFDVDPAALISYPVISALGKDQTLPFFASPAQAYINLFGSVSDSEEVQRKIALEKNLLKFVAGDIQKNQKSLSEKEKAKLDHYLLGVNSMVSRQERMAKLTRLKEFTPEFTEKYKSTDNMDMFECHMELGTAALQAGLTNVVTVKADELNQAYRRLGQNFTVHGIGHMSQSGSTGNNDNLGDEAQSRTLGDKLRYQIREYQVNQIAKMATTLKNTPEPIGVGNMLDNTMIIYLSESGPQHHPRQKNHFPFVTVGGLGGYVQTGKMIYYPNQANKTLSSMYNTLLHVTGNALDHFGQKDPKLNSKMQEGPLKELLA